MNPVWAALPAVLLTISLAAPSAVADHVQVTISVQPGSGQDECGGNDSCYEPDEATIDAGGKVVWYNNDTMPHTVRVLYPNGTALVSGAAIPSGQAYSVRIHDAGTYDFHDPDYAWLSGTILVQESAGTDGRAPETLNGTVRIGALYPLTGQLNSTGAELRAATDMAVADYNDYLEAMGAGWRLDVVIRDTASNLVSSLERVQTLFSDGVGIVLGPSTDTNTKNVKEFADSNGMLLISCCSTAPDLAVPNDSIFRLVPSDLGQATALGKLLEDRGVDVLVPVWRGDTHGDLLRNATAAAFEARGGVVGEGVRYGPDASNMSGTVSLLALQVAPLVEEYGADGVAVLAVSFGETRDILQGAGEYDSLGAVSWFGLGDVARAPYNVVDGGNASSFADMVGFTGLQFMVSPGERFQSVRDRISQEVGVNDTNPLAYPAYDGVWLAGESIMRAASSDPDDVKAVLPDVAESYTGAMRSAALNEAGDLALANYQIWEVVDGQWTKTQKYAAEKDLLAAADQPSGDIMIGSLYPLTGALHSKGYANQVGTQLGVDDFNAFLGGINVDWRLSLVTKDSKTDPATALKRAQALFGSGIDIIIGPETSWSTLAIKPYADTNDMMLISCCSTAPALAIPNDSVFRLVPDDSKQGVAVSKLLRTAGIDAIVPIWRGDAYGDGLQNSTRTNFESRGGVVDQGVRYDTRAADLSAEVETLAKRVESLVERYGADGVAVFMISFDKSIQIVQEASNHDILDDIRWFGSESLTHNTPMISDPASNEFANAVRFTAMQIVVNRSDAHPLVPSHIYDAYGRDPATIGYQAYDASWLVGLSMLKSGATDASTIKATLPGVAADYVGVLGGTVLNEAGDLRSADYAVWGIVGDKWVETGRYSLLDDTITISASDGNTNK